MIREPVAMGYFYPEGLSNIRNLLNSFNVVPAKEKIDAFGIISPHAGYVYSGKTAYTGYSRINVKNNIIIIGPNHTGMGADYSVMGEGKYGFRDFNISVNSELADAIIKDKGSPFAYDEIAHTKEHSVEVQIPLLYNFKKDFSIVPIIVSFMRYSDALNASAAIFNAIKGLDLLNDVLIVASSDMTHYEPAESARFKDDIAIKEILDLNPSGLYDKVREYKISMCGFIPAAIMLNVAKMADRTNARLIEYTNSGEVTGDYTSVVGYSSIVVY
ncbi:AmmeMemoRadiSam system protein B [Candidatus Acidulodesulfobacterium sp. H_13]|uniref:AmmeMemoRadiSam system protein B n=1 Tax=Candidatus Acidulodesulfobacterium sp. H_13 TaxID=3395470 RepID=UPI003AF91EA2